MNKKMKILSLFIAGLSIISFSGCDYSKKKIEQLRCEHEMNDGEITIQATCEDVGEKTLTCTLCGYEETVTMPAVGHKWYNVDSVAPTCTVDGHGQGIQCIVCDEWLVGPFNVPAFGHTNEVVLGHEPTCTETGLTNGEKCTVCDSVLQAQLEIPANGHTLEVIEGYSPTCTDAGLTDGIKCIVCDSYFQQQEIIPSPGCVDEDGNQFCDNCGMILQLKEGSYQEVEATVGEAVVGNWYRIYRRNNDNKYFTLSTNICITGTTQNLVVGIKSTKYFIGGDFHNASLFSPSNSIILVAVDCMDYVDIYFVGGTFTAEEFDYIGLEFNSSDAIDETTTITDMQLTVYRLVPIEQ